MQRLTNDQLREMFVLQDALNRVVNPSWLTANYAWNRAIRVECAELSDHIGWKWWKKQEPNWPQAHIELVDIWHFMLSGVLVEARGDYDAAVREMNQSLMFPHGEVIEIGGRKFTVGGLKLSEQVDMLSMFASLNYSFAALFEALLVGTGLTWDALRHMYVGKNVLNKFRQDHGYKLGTYEKMWHGVEDNVYLERILAAQPNLSADDLRDELWAVYKTVPLTATQQPEAA